MYTGGSCVSMNADLAGRGMRAQDAVVADVEGVVRRGGRVPGGVFSAVKLWYVSSTSGPSKIS